MGVELANPPPVPSGQRVHRSACKGAIIAIKQRPQHRRERGLSEPHSSDSTRTGYGPRFHNAANPPDDVAAARCASRSTFECDFPATKHGAAAFGICDPQACFFSRSLKAHAINDLGS